MRLESLHNHTTLSDGEMDHLSLLGAAEQAGLGVIAFTDHDAVPDESVIDRLAAYKGPVKWLTGVELSVVAPADANAKDRGFIHLLGLFTDPLNSALLERCRQIEQSRIRRMESFTKHFHQLGLEVTEAEIRAEAGGSSVGSPHMVAAIMKHPQNASVIEQLLKEFKQNEADYPELAEDLRRGGPNQIPYTLFMRRTSYKPAPDTMEAAIDIDEGTRLIRQAGGIAVLAHWYWDKAKLPLEYVSTMLSEGRLDGLGTFIFNAVNDYDVREEAGMLERLAAQHGAAAVIGADAHDARDLHVFATQPEAKLSVGQTQRLIERFKPDLRFSNL